MTEAAARGPKTLTLDSEVTMFDAEPVFRLEWLRHLNHGDLATPPFYVVFDLLPLGEKDYGLSICSANSSPERLTPQATAT